MIRYATATYMKVDMSKKLHYVFIVALILYAVMHVYSWSNNPPDVDPINFTMALDHYDISTDRPHPPGYPLYVGLGRIASNVVSPQHAYQLVNLIMLIAAAISFYVAALKKGHPQIGLACGLLLLTHPLTLATTVIAETYFSDAFFGCLIAAWILSNGERVRTQRIGMVIIFLALGLFRAVSCMELMLMALACVYITSTTNHLKNIIISASLIVSSTVIAYLITVWLAGGYQTYSAAVVKVMGSSFAQKSFFAGAPLKEHLLMDARLYIWLGFASFPAFLAAGYVFKKYSSKPLLNHEAKKILIVCTCWLFPPLGLFTLFYFLKPTYLLILMPPIFIIFTLSVFFIFRAHSMVRAWFSVTLVIFLQLSIFYGGTKALPAPIYKITHAYMKQQDAAWVELINIVKRENDENGLFIWISHPSLTFYAIRLLPWKGKFAYKERIYVDTNKSHPEILKNIKLMPVSPLQMIWGKPEESLNRYIKSNKFSKILVLSNKFGRATYETYDIDTFNRQSFIKN